MKKALVWDRRFLKGGAKILSGVALSAVLATSPIAAMLPQDMGSIVVFAGDNDFNWGT